MSVMILGLMILGIWGCSPESKKNDQGGGASVEGTTEAVSEKGVGPVQSVEMGERIDEALAKKGEEIFKTKCSACHATEKRLVGPPLSGVTQRRKPEWIMNMILNPEEMTRKDPVARKLLEEYMTQMTYQNVTEEEARAILEYLRTI